MSYQRPSLCSSPSRPALASVGGSDTSSGASEWILPVLLVGGGAALYMEMRRERAKEEASVVQGRAFYASRHPERSRAAR
jgi:hypothetical protein